MTYQSLTNLCRLFSSPLPRVLSSSLLI